MIYFSDFDIVGAGTDPYWSSVSMLIGAESVSGSSWLDEGPNALGAMGRSNVSHTTTSPIQGARGLYLNSAGGIGSYNDNGLFELNGVNFTIDVLAKWNTTSISSGQYHYLLAKWHPVLSQRQWAFLRSGDANNISFWTNPTGSGSTVAYNATGTWTPTADQVYHIAVDYDGSKVRLYRDGTCILATTAAPSIFNGTATMTIFNNSQGGGNWPTGTSNQMDEIRLTKGVARYASDSGFDPVISTRAKTYGWPRS